MTGETILIAGSAASIGFAHTILGPDHYLPFVAMAKAKGWNGSQTATYVTLCGLGHVMGTILLCLVGLFLGIVVFKLESLQSIRGDLAGWFLVAFGLFYFLWGAWHALRDGSHGHTHFHAGGHSHAQVDERGEGKTKLARVTPWLLFVFFILGPCEPLIPLITYQSAELNLTAASIVALTFGATTVLTMLACVMACYYGLSRVSLPRSFERYAHAFSGLVILLCGLAIQFLGL